MAAKNNPMYKYGLVIKKPPVRRSQEDASKCPQCYRTEVFNGKCERCKFEINVTRMMMI